MTDYPLGLTRDQFLDRLIGVYAYDQGAVDSGIRDEAFKEATRLFFKAMSEAEFNRFISPIVRDWFLSDEAIAHGYGIEDIASFWKWLEDKGL